VIFWAVFWAVGAICGAGLVVAALCVAVGEWFAWREGRDDGR
jgi:hypothetical protein